MNIDDDLEDEDHPLHGLRNKAWESISVLGVTIRMIKGEDNVH